MKVICSHKKLNLKFKVSVAIAADAYYPLAYNDHLLRHRTRAAGGHRTRGGSRHIPYLNCLSWRLGVEANNIRDWARVPRLCEGYIGHYMLGRQYRDDCTAVAASAIRYATAVELVHDGKDVWVFDIDETALSNLPYYARVEVGFGIRRCNATKFEEWIRDGKAPAMQETLRLYNSVLALGMKPVFISETKEQFRSARISNLRKAGFRAWEMLILRGANDTERPMMDYKSEKRTELVARGYRIVGNVGDQWSDLLGENVGLRTFKMPDPMYYVS
ncbi:PREDICTED: acid phosphatase 1-like [Ipomoea nil]|uniref:acid phosphatase 1-like n=1 Tax=Ipomoea nil TaxID=35883 RepID=UPI0009011CED|nr:PREDICTED: acid phosphatase 1-like [Ipomoea nil]